MKNMKNMLKNLWVKYNEVIVLVSSMLLIIGFAVSLIVGLVYKAGQSDCDNIHNLYNVETTYYLTSGCYMKINNKWVNAHFYVKFNALKNNNININLINQQ